MVVDLRFDAFTVEVVVDAIFTLMESDILHFGLRWYAGLNAFMITRFENAILNEMTKETEESS